MVKQLAFLVLLKEFRSLSKQGLDNGDDSTNSQENWRQKLADIISTLGTPPPDNENGSAKKSPRNGNVERFSSSSSDDLFSSKRTSNIYIDAGQLKRGKFERTVTERFIYETICEDSD